MGWRGLDITQDVEMAMELGYTSLAVRSMFGTNNGIAGQVLVGFGTEEQKSRWLAGIAAGDVVASFALTESGRVPILGPAHRGRTRRRRVGHQRRQAVHHQRAGRRSVHRFRPHPSGPTPDGPGIAVFLVPADTPGVGIGPKDAKMGQEGAWTSDVFQRRPGRPGSTRRRRGGPRIPRRHDLLGAGRIHIAALAVGTAQRALDESVSHAATATQGGTAIGTFQLVQAMLADQQTGVMAGARWCATPPASG